MSSDMLGLRNTVSLFLLVFICDGLAVDKCVPHPPCLCEFDDGRVIDLNPLAKGDFFQGSKGNLTYYFHLCANKNLTIPALNTTVQNCKDGTSLCVFDHGNNTITNYGKVQDAQIVPSVTDTGLNDIIFVDKKTNQTTFITLVCIAIEETILHVEHSSTFPKQHDLMLFSHFACPHVVSHGLSTGSVFVIIFLVLSTVYLLGGAAILHFLRGARGKEMIPNIDFWSDLPLLVRDGVVFLQNGCKPPQQPGETYDRI